MCNRKQFKVELDEAAKRFNVELAAVIEEITTGEQHAFDHPYSPIIRAESPEFLETNYHWGLVPQYWKTGKEDIWNKTYNAKLDELHLKNSYKNITHQRCLVPTTSYFEHHWNDLKGKSKTLYEIWHPDNEIFSLAGLWSTYTDFDGSEYKSYTVITTEANQRMRFVHNKDQQDDYFRMPLMLNPEDEKSWLDTKIPYMDFEYPNYQPRLIAEPVAGQAPPPPPQLSLEF